MVSDASSSSLFTSTALPTVTEGLGLSIMEVHTHQRYYEDA